MTLREKKLALAVTAMIGCFIVWGLIKSQILVPATKADEDGLRLREQIAALQTSIARKPYYQKRLASLAQQTYAGDEGRVRAKMLERLVAMGKQSGLNTRNKWNLSPVTGKRKRGIYSEVGWRVSARGRLEHVVNFLYLLCEDPHLHRLSGLSLSTEDQGRQVQISARYITIVLDSQISGKSAEAKELKVPSLDDSRRKQYNAIVMRDLFRPYVKRRPRPGPPVVAKTPERPPPEAEPVERRLKVVSLSRLAKAPHVCIYNTRSGQVRYYKAGDKLLGGEIVKIDYRRMPRIDKPRILSGSRVIVKIGEVYWAVELGQMLADKHRLGGAQLPVELRETPKKQSGGQSGPSDKDV
ncbi:MAG: hypothetical protein J7M14_00175 [Planctomycetes bacterium]|nr:hypothetical protein [Planctomycetota bacterium]